jgi:phage shock protein A
VERLAEAVLILAQQVVELALVTERRLNELDTEVELMRTSLVRLERKVEHE